MLAVGTPEALAAIAQVRPEFSAIVIPVELEPTPTSQIPIVDAAALAAADAAIAAETTAPDVAPADDESSDDSGPDFPFPPEAPLTPDTPAEAPVQPEAPIEPTPDVPDAPDEPEPEVAPEPEPEPEPPAEPEAPLSMFAPPALVEPTLAEPAQNPHPMSGSTVLPDDWFTADSPLAAPPAARAPVEPVVAVTPAEPAEPRHFDDLLTGLADEAEAAGVPSATSSAPLLPLVPAASTGEGPVATGTASTAPVAVEPRRRPLFSLEQSGLEPTPVEYRVGRAARLFWLWFAANSSIVGIAFGAMIFSLGMSLRQSIVAALAGVALSFIPLGLGTLAGKRSGQPTVVVSRAAFGVAGNVVPAILALVSRVFWGAALLWLFAKSIAATVGPAGSTSGLEIVFIVVGVMVAVVVAFLGYTLLARVQLLLSIVSALLIVGFVALTYQRIDVQSALTVDDGPWILVLTGAVLVFSFVGLVWANSSSDLARYQRHGGSGGTTMLWATFGATLPTFLLIAYGALLAASDSSLATELVANPIDALTALLPVWYSIPLMVAVALSLFSGVIITVYSGAFALQGVGLRLERQWATLFAGVLLALGAAVFTILSVDFASLFRDLATTIAVPVAAWSGIFAADTMIRNRSFHTESLLRPGGVYPTVNWVNLPALVAISVVGWGLTTATAAGLGWQGYAFSLLGVPLAGELASSDLGVVVALLLGILTPIVSGIPAIRRQEAAAPRN
jgi:purine-cytosine permease-like protein